MNLWIRSQDKKSLRIVSDINIIHEDGKMFICNYMGIANIKLGTYKTEQRALEVLDEIQSKINDIHKDYLMSCMKEKGTYEIIAWEDFVYEMPKK